MAHLIDVNQIDYAVIASASLLTDPNYVFCKSNRLRRHSLFAHGSVNQTDYGVIASLLTDPNYVFCKRYGLTIRKQDLGHARTR